jgi:hypothetical protein
MAPSMITINKFARVLSGAIHSNAVTRLVKCHIPRMATGCVGSMAAVGPHIVAAQRLQLRVVIKLA